jgi:hypothetical protein
MVGSISKGTGEGMRLNLTLHEVEAVKSMFSVCDLSRITEPSLIHLVSAMGKLFLKEQELYSAPEIVAKVIEELKKEKTKGEK